MRSAPAWAFLLGIASPGCLVAGAPPPLSKTVRDSVDSANTTAANTDGKGYLPIPQTLSEITAAISEGHHGATKNLVAQGTPVETVRDSVDPANTTAANTDGKGYLPIPPTLSEITAAISEGHHGATKNLVAQGTPVELKASDHGGARKNIIAQGTPVELEASDHGGARKNLIAQGTPVELEAQHTKNETLTSPEMQPLPSPLLVGQQQLWGLGHAMLLANQWRAAQWYQWVLHSKVRKYTEEQQAKAAPAPRAPEPQVLPIP